jgi:hypothetical protein
VKAAELRAELKRALMDGAPHRATGMEWCRAVDVLINAVIDEERKSCFANSPVTAWLMGSPSHRFLLAEYDEETKRIRVNLDDIDDEEDEPVATGTGESVEQAIADALNKLEAEAH